jgi:hypothetical protein
VCRTSGEEIKRKERRKEEKREKKVAIVEAEE